MLSFRVARSTHFIGPSCCAGVTGAAAAPAAACCLTLATACYLTPAAAHFLTPAAAHGLTLAVARLASVPCSLQPRMRGVSMSPHRALSTLATVLVVLAAVVPVTRAAPKNITIAIPGTINPKLDGTYLKGANASQFSLWPSPKVSASLRHVLLLSMKLSSAATPPKPPCELMNVIVKLCCWPCAGMPKRWSIDLL